MRRLKVSRLFPPLIDDRPAEVKRRELEENTKSYNEWDKSAGTIDYTKIDYTKQPPPIEEEEA